MTIPGGAPALFFTAAAGAAADYAIDRSLRFNPADSAYLSKTFSAGNSKKWTWSGWIKKCFTAETSVPSGDGHRGIFTARSSGTNYAQLSIGSSGGNYKNYLRFRERDSSGTVAAFDTTQVFRDPSSWFHLVLVWDSSNGTSGDRIRLYINGARVTAFDSITYPSSSADSVHNTAIAHNLGYDAEGTAYFDGYLADIQFLDGIAASPTDFGETDSNGVWQPKAYSGSYGSPNGFHLKFADNSSDAALGTDTSGNSNTWTVNNLSTSRSGNGTYGATISNSTLNYDPSVIFNGNPASSYVDRPVNNSTVTFTGIPAANTSVKIYLTSLESGTMTTNGNYAVSPGSQFPNAYIEPTNVSYPFTLTSITVTGGNAGQGYGIGAIEVDGVELQSQSGPEADVLVDTPEQRAGQSDDGSGGNIVGNYATWNPLFNSSGTYTDGNLQLLTTAGNRHYQATFGLTSGKWYWEVEPDSGSTPGMIGIALGSKDITGNLNGAGAMSYYSVTGYKQGGNTSGVDQSYGNTYTYGNIIGVALDLDSGTKTLTFYKDGVSQGVAFNPDVSLGAWFPAVSAGSSSSTTTFIANFGQRPFANANVPSGYKALNTANLPTPTIADGSTAFDVALYNGSGSNQNITGLNFEPSFIWLKARNHNTWHVLNDAVRGAGKNIYSNDSYQEVTKTDNLTSFNSDGFSLGADSNSDGVNISGKTYVSWNWAAGSSTATNTDGSITSSIRASQSAGCSIVKWAGTGSVGTVGHGLGATLGWVIVKSLGNAREWVVWHSSFGTANNTDYLYLDTTGAKGGSGPGGYWNQTAPTTTTFSVGDSAAVNGSGSDYIAYCFAPVEGYSAFGSYTGNGSQDGPFVYCGFRPAFILWKRSGTAANWYIQDSTRTFFNPANGVLRPNTSDAELTSSQGQIMDSLSNGFKVKNYGTEHNASGGEYIWACFAENPFSLARAR